MKVDLSTAVTLYAIDVQSARTLRLQVQPGAGDPSSAVIEIKRAFASGANTPSVSFSTAKTLDLSGASITEIDVTDTGWVHVVCTTAVSGVSVDIDHRTSGTMTGTAFQSRVELDDLGSLDRLSSLGAYRAFVLAAPTVAVTTGVLEIKQSLDPLFTPASFTPAGTLTLDGSTITQIGTDAADTLHAVCTTAQSGLGVDLYWYLRDEVPKDSDTRLVSIFAEEGAAIASASNFQWSQGNGDVQDGFGIVVPYAGELVAASLSVWSNSAGTCTVEVYKGADADTTSSATGVSVSLASGERHNYADYSNSPVTVNAGDWITFRTTANAGGTITGGRVAAWLRVSE